MRRTDKARLAQDRDNLKPSSPGANPPETDRYPVSCIDHHPILVARELRYSLMLQVFVGSRLENAEK